MIQYKQRRCFTHSCVILIIGIIIRVIIIIEIKKTLTRISDPMDLLKIGRQKNA